MKNIDFMIIYFGKKICAEFGNSPHIGFLNIHANIVISNRKLIFSTRARLFLYSKFDHLPKTT